MAGVICNLKQGTDEWLEFRNNHFSSSEAAAMLGISKHMTRDELLFKKYTGIEKEYNSYTLNLFQRGHDAEESARRIIEKQVCEELFPAVYAMDNLMGSVDGITLDESIAFEHKLFNLRLHDSVSKGILPKEYEPQCQQILMVTGAKKLIFVCSDGTEEKIAQMEVMPDESYFLKLIDGWKQFNIDLESYEKQIIRNDMNTNLIIPSKETALEVFQKPNGLDPFLKIIRDEIDIFIPDVTTKKGREEIASIAYRISKSKTALDDVGKNLVSDLKELPKKIDAERKRVRDLLDNWKDEVRRPLTEWENADKERINKIQERIFKINNLISDYESLSSEAIKNNILLLKSITIDSSFEELELEAARTKDTVLNKLESQFLSKQKIEQEQAELAKLRAEAEERDKKDKEERIAKEAAEKAIKEAEMKLQKEREDHERKELELKLEVEKANREKLEALKREEETKRKIEEEIRNKNIADKKRANDLEHKTKINRAAVEAFVNNGIDEKASQLVINLIVENKIPNIYISY